MNDPLVSVICLCYNHENFVIDAIDSVLNQSYANIELIVCDDNSTDQSAEVIREYIQDKSEIKFIELKTNRGNCTAFNIAYKASKGEYIIDLAGDDLLLKDRVSTGVNELEKAGKDFGVHYGHGIIIDEKGHNLITESGPLPSGDLYIELISRYFINPASMMMRRSVLEQLGGYDESLSYEDFDFWIRSSRHFNYLAHENPIVKKRKVTGSLSGQQRIFRNKHLKSTFRVCQKIKKLNRNNSEKVALRKRVLYEIRQCIRYGDLILATKYLKLL